ncbi:MAG TPA: ATP-binding protein [Dehalococcoidales bacterium]|nr:ATP-binding protein [Dehalococcoidales bacterium]
MRLSKNKTTKPRDLHWLRISLMFLACTLVYYLPAIFGLGGGILDKDTINSLHNFYGLDFFAMAFFIPVVYAAYSIGVVRAVLVALASALVFLPYSFFVTDQPGTFFRPTSFVLILSAVGAVVAMLQRGDEQKKRSLDELKCLYEIGRSTEKNDSVEKYIHSVVDIIRLNLSKKGEIQVSINLRGQTFFKIEERKFMRKISEPIWISGEEIGRLDLAYPSAYTWNKKSNHFVKTLAERIGGAVHAIELEQSLKAYYEQLEIMVERRTRELEQAQEKLIRSERLAAVGELASGVGHELRNPLNVIRNCVYLINMHLEGKSTSEIEETLKLLDVQVDISNKIVSDLLDYTRVKTPMRNTVDLNIITKDRVAWANVPEKIRVFLELSPESPQIFVDAEQVGRALSNLINNAVQSISGSGEITVKTEIKDGQAVVKISDTGCGISKENMAKLFEPLFTTKSRGVGLGLAISKRMVEQNHGEITVESAVGKGTTFTLWLPLINKETFQNEETGHPVSCR